MNKKALLEMFDYLHDAIVDNCDDIEWCRNFTENFDEIKKKI